jgi:hypothetical protein
MKLKTELEMKDVQRFLREEMQRISDFELISEDYHNLKLTILSKIAVKLNSLSFEFYSNLIGLNQINERLNEYAEGVANSILELLMGLPFNPAFAIAVLSKRRNLA